VVGMIGFLKRFVLVRDVDVSGVSGEGVIVCGVLFPDGRAAYRWITPTPTTCIADKVDDLMAIHGHDGATRLVWLDDDERGLEWYPKENRGRPAA